MPYSKEFLNKERSLIKFSLIEPVSKDDMKTILGYVSALLELNKHFSFLIDTTKANRPPLDATIILITWLKNNRPNIKKGYLLGTSVVMSSENSGIINEMLTSAFKIYPTITPNKITTNYDEGLKFITDLLEKHKKTQHKLVNQIQ